MRQDLHKLSILASLRLPALRKKTPPTTPLRLIPWMTVDIVKAASTST